MDQEARNIFNEAVERLTEYRILMAIPTVYATHHDLIFPVCAALSNFSVIEKEGPTDPGDLHAPQQYTEVWACIPQRILGFVMENEYMFDLKNGCNHFFKLVYTFGGLLREWLVLYVFFG